MVNIFIKTYGCVANQDNGAIIAGLLIESGFTLVNSIQEADIVIINSCTVKGVTENKIISELRKISKDKTKKIILAGCMAGAQENKIKKEFNNISLISTQNTTKIVDVVKKLTKGEIITLIKKEKEIKVDLPKLLKNKTVAVQISEGCLGSCTYCITKLAKGDLFSFPEEKILNEIKTRIKQGIKTIYLTSQDNAAYGLDNNHKSKLPGLLQKITNLEGNFQIRVGMMNPKHTLPILNELIEIFKNEKIMKFIHIPVQSGSDKVIKEMNRGYTIAKFKKIINTFRKEIPEIDVATDIIAGYPTETEQDFQETVDLVNEMKFDVLNISKFASRPGTVASKLKKVITEEVKRRSTIIHDIYWTQRKEKDGLNKTCSALGFQR